MAASSLPLTSPLCLLPLVASSLTPGCCAPGCLQLHRQSPVEKLPASSAPDLPGIKLESCGLGIPVRLLHKLAGHVVMVVLKTGEVYRAPWSSATITGTVSSAMSPSPPRMARCRSSSTPSYEETRCRTG